MKRKVGTVVLVALLLLTVVAIKKLDVTHTDLAKTSYHTEQSTN